MSSGSSDSDGADTELVLVADLFFFRVVDALEPSPVLNIPSLS